MKYVLDSVNMPEDIKKLNIGQLNRLALELRSFVLENVSKTGGHLASNLGIVELTLALHYCFDAPKDKIVWDVGHQAYIHKILTGRKDKFTTLRQLDGLSGFPKPSESEYDTFTAGHSSTSISIALGFACARDMRGSDEKVVAVIGDGSLTGGVAFEALNNAGRSNSNIIVVLNDNQMSISGNVGALSRHLGELRTERGYIEAKNDVKKLLNRFPDSEKMVNKIKRTKNRIKYLFIPGVIFEELGFKYIGPVDGNNIESLIEVINRAKNIEGPVLIHVKTKKGKGYKYAENNPSAYHGVSAFDLSTGASIKKSNKPTYSDVFGKTMCSMADEDDKIVAVSAAMGNGTGLSKFISKHPSRFYDVGIAEQHAVSFSAALAKSGFRPVFAVYSTFLQRAYDEIMQDVCLQNLHVVFAVDRAGIVGADGETHQGIYDISYFTHMPNMTVMMPKNGIELEKMLRYAVYNIDGPVAVRYPRGNISDIYSENTSEIEFGKAELLEDGEKIAVISAGAVCDNAAKVCEMLKNDGYNPMLINMRFAKPVDKEMLKLAAEKCGYIFTLEDNVIDGGAGMAVLEALNDMELMNDVKVHSYAFPDKFIEHGTRDQLFERYKLDSESIYKDIKERIDINGR
ncbi:1-deoxy-D-xylulose-5-phosphate synthase [Anaerotignum sp. MSJ-24]|uniref:1-deoxy-D-xylulose-5-phosphate synthase n=1 Tax=Anaerotignum sp. MSJ-24 TaxID=2841521 RepID=UPI001C110C6F|nr:1-deoxy-D-xylulose-5-phosphate synthase [Anaerotignum sp. MSJ-24]MBU5463832.1 1-deoxy-D-xylulose-5-phosphate synthase [Anaerotignum sp. MSJ-24]